MANQLEYYTETGGLRDDFDQGLLVMAAYTTFCKGVYQSRALSLKNKHLMALVRGIRRVVPAAFSGRKGAIDAGAMKDEVPGRYL